MKITLDALPRCAALTVLVPAVGPSVSEAVANPLTLVTELAGVTLPPPACTLQSMVIPLSGAPRPSVAFTVSGVASAVPTTPLCWLPAFAARVTSVLASVPPLQPRATSRELAIRKRKRIEGTPRQRAASVLVHRRHIVIGVTARQYAIAAHTVASHSPPHPDPYADLPHRSGAVERDRIENSQIKFPDLAQRSLAEKRQLQPPI